ncbi:MAG: hypothetical protein EBX40_01810, partial [Gammaproteobacteria bacterium]|nr:hypothetical protein [Gammaproteobacteria bacterium]
TYRVGNPFPVVSLDPKLFVRSQDGVDLVMSSDFVSGNPFWVNPTYNGKVVRFSSISGDIQTNAVNEDSHGNPVPGVAQCTVVQIGDVNSLPSEYKSICVKFNVVNRVMLATGGISFTVKRGSACSVTGAITASFPTPFDGYTNRGTVRVPVILDGQNPTWRVQGFPFPFTQNDASITVDCNSIPLNTVGVHRFTISPADLSTLATAGIIEYGAEYNSTVINIGHPLGENAAFFPQNFGGVFRGVWHTQALANFDQAYPTVDGNYRVNCSVTTTVPASQAQVWAERRADGVTQVHSLITAPITQVPYNIVCQQDATVYPSPDTKTAQVIGSVQPSLGIGLPTGTIIQDGVFTTVPMNVTTSPLTTALSASVAVMPATSGIQFVPPVGAVNVNQNGATWTFNLPVSALSLTSDAQGVLHGQTQFQMAFSAKEAISWNANVQVSDAIVNPTTHVSTALNNPVSVQTGFAVQNRPVVRTGDPVFQQALLAEDGSVSALEGPGVWHTGSSTTLCVDLNSITHDPDVGQARVTTAQGSSSWMQVKVSDDGLKVCVSPASGHVPAGQVNANAAGVIVNNVGTVDIQTGDGFTAQAQRVQLKKIPVPILNNVISPNQNKVVVKATADQTAIPVSLPNVHDTVLNDGTYQDIDQQAPSYSFNASQPLASSGITSISSRTGNSFVIDGFLPNSAGRIYRRDMILGDLDPNAVNPAAGTTIDRQTLPNFFELQIMRRGYVTNLQGLQTTFNIARGRRVLVLNTVLAGGVFKDLDGDSRGFSLSLTTQGVPNGVTLEPHFATKAGDVSQVWATVTDPSVTQFSFGVSVSQLAAENQIDGSVNSASFTTTVSVSNSFAFTAPSSLSATQGEWHNIPITVQKISSVADAVSFTIQVLPAENGLEFRSQNGLSYTVVGGNTVQVTVPASQIGLLTNGLQMRAPAASSNLQRTISITGHDALNGQPIHTDVQTTVIDQASAVNLPPVLVANYELPFSSSVAQSSDTVTVPVGQMATHPQGKQLVYSGNSTNPNVMALSVQGTNLVMSFPGEGAANGTVCVTDRVTAPLCLSKEVIVLGPSAQSWLSQALGWLIPSATTVGVVALALSCLAPFGCGVWSRRRKAKAAINDNIDWKESEEYQDIIESIKKHAAFKKAMTSQVTLEYEISTCYSRLIRMVTTQCDDLRKADFIDLVNRLFCLELIYEHDFLKKAERDVIKSPSDVLGLTDKVLEAIHNRISSSHNNEETLALAKAFYLLIGLIGLTRFSHDPVHQISYKIRNRWLQNIDELVGLISGKKMLIDHEIMAFLKNARAVIQVFYVSQTYCQAITENFSVAVTFVCKVFKFLSETGEVSSAQDAKRLALAKALAGIAPTLSRPIVEEVIEHCIDWRSMVVAYFILLQLNAKDRLQNLSKQPLSIGCLGYLRDALCGLVSCGTYRHKLDRARQIARVLLGENDFSKCDAVEPGVRRVPDAAVKRYAAAMTTESDSGSPKTPKTLETFTAVNPMHSAGGARPVSSPTAFHLNPLALTMADQRRGKTLSVVDSPSSAAGESKEDFVAVPESKEKPLQVDTSISPSKPLMSPFFNSRAAAVALARGNSRARVAARPMQSSTGADSTRSHASMSPGTVRSAASSQSASPPEDAVVNTKSAELNDSISPELLDLKTPHANELRGIYCNSLQPWSPGESIATLYSDAEPSESSPLIIAFDEIDESLERIHNGIESHKNLKICVQNKQGWNQMLDEVQMGFYPNLIIIMTTNKSPDFINNLDPSYIRNHRVDSIYCL